MIKREDLDAAALTVAHLAVEDVLVEMRDSMMSVLGPANGFVINERDGTPSSVIRIGTRHGLEIAIAAYLNALDPSYVQPGAGGTKTPGNRRDTERFEALDRDLQVRVAGYSAQLYDGSRTIAACWREALDWSEKVSL